MKGQNIIKHPDKEEIERMLNEGYTPDEVSKWLKQKHKHKMYYISEVSISAYRSNFMRLTREELSARRKDLLSTGNTRDSNVIETFSASKDFIESREKMTAEVVNAIENFKSIQDKVLERINLIDQNTRDADGKPIYKARNEEILEKYLGRLESMTNSFVKLQDVLEKRGSSKGGTTEIQITMNEMNKYAEVYKGIMQRVLTKLDPVLLNDFFLIFSEEKEKAMQDMGIVSGDSNVKISISNNSSQVNITTTTASDPPQISKVEKHVDADYMDLDEEATSEE